MLAQRPVMFLLEL